MQVIDFQVKVSKNKGVRGTLVLSKKPAAAAPTQVQVQVTLVVWPGRLVADA